MYSFIRYCCVLIDEREDGSEERNTIKRKMTEFGATPIPSMTPLEIKSTLQTLVGDTNL